MSPPNNVFLVGPMGAGKTTIGRQLAETLGFEFRDSDQVIQRRTGVDIPTIFEFEGESGFRKREKAVIDDVTQETGVVLATGGGAILDPDNRRLLTSRGFVVYLFCSPEQQYERTLRDRNRPLLQNQDPMQTLIEIFNIRDPLYRQVADLVVSTERRNAGSVLQEIKTELSGGTRHLRGSDG
ncbi:MAG: shikimate kinase AroK [Pseudomonadota bacterium]